MRFNSVALNSGQDGENNLQAYDSGQTFLQRNKVDDQKSQVEPTKDYSNDEGSSANKRS